jgi:hypothetical protein
MLQIVTSLTDDSRGIIYNHISLRTGLLWSRFHRAATWDFEIGHVNETLEGKYNVQRPPTQPDFFWHHKKLIFQQDYESMNGY